MMGMVGLGEKERKMLSKLKVGIEKSQVPKSKLRFLASIFKNTFQNTTDLNHRKRTLQPSPNSIDKIR